MVEKCEEDDLGVEWKVAERLATEHLIVEGYTIRERNWRAGHLEVDIIAQLGNTIVFVEVKSRSGRHRDPLDAIDSKKIRNLMRAADRYLKMQEDFFDARFDVITIVGTAHDRKLDHIPDAFVLPLW